MSGPKPHKLSGGETKRVALARALAIRPKVLLCDEPTANVDSENQKVILDILAAINRQERISIIFSTHYQSLEQQLAHNCLHLQHGHIAESQVDNVFQAELVERGRQRTTFRLAAGITLSLPHRSGVAAYPSSTWRSISSRSCSPEKKTMFRTGVWWKAG